jgi:hypothetical protein
MSTLGFRPRLPMSLAFAASLASLCVAQPQIIEKAPRDFKLDGDVSEWKGNTPFSPGKAYWESIPIRVAQTNAGIVVAGFSQFYDAGLATNFAELPTKGRVEVWLSEADPIEMPGIAWVEQERMGPDMCDLAYGDEQRKRTCLKWLGDQAPYREKLRALFTRMWRMAPDVTEEAYASPIFDSMNEAQKAALKPLKPAGLPTSKFIFDEWRRKFSFEILIPWDAFPPATRLQIERIKLAVAIIERDRVIASTQREPNEPIANANLRSFFLSPAVVTHFTPCEFPLVDETGEPGFYFMTDSKAVKTAFTLKNRPLSTSLIQLPEPDDVSPRVALIAHFVQRLSPTESLCSDPLSYRKGNSIKRLPFNLGPGPHFWSFDPLPTSWPVIRLANGTRLIKEGPEWLYYRQTSVMCSACPWAKLALYAIMPSGEIKMALTLGDRVGGAPEIDDYDIQVSSDWRTVKEFAAREGVWTSKIYCLSGDIYRPCGTGNQAPPAKRGMPPPPQ